MAPEQALAVLAVAFVLAVVVFVVLPARADRRRRQRRLKMHERRGRDRWYNAGDGDTGPGSDTGGDGGGD